jgi:Cysteine-rich CWC
MSDQGTGCTTEKTCPRCTATFECQSAGCWCNDVRLSAARLKWLERHYENCLCPACLASIESCSEPGVNAPNQSESSSPLTECVWEINE